MVSMVAGNVFTSRQWCELKEDLRLPPRQAEVVQQLLHGRSDKQIALVLGMSVPTVRSHLRRLFGRFNVEDRCELIAQMYLCLLEKCRVGGDGQF